MAQARSAHDRRSVRIRLTEKGINLRNAIDAAYDRHVEVLAGSKTGP